jgi:glycosyltransferase involved in cell wall biosynthesis
MNSKVSIIIPTKNRIESLSRCLDSLVAQRYANFEVIVVDGGSTDGTVAMVREKQKKLQIDLVTVPGGLVEKMNEGLRQSQGDFFIRIDDDVVTSREWLESIVTTFATSPRVGGVTGPTIIPEDRRDARDLLLFQRKFLRGNIFWRSIGTLYYYYLLEGEPFAIGKWFKSGAFSLGSNYYFSTKLVEPIEVTHHEACNMAVRTHVLRQIGGFDQIYTGLGEFHEPDVSFKMREMGYKVLFDPHAVVNHILSRGGYFQDRPDSYGRVINFINFYFRHIRTDKPDKMIRLLSYLLFLNMYWLHTFLSSKQASQLGSISGTLRGLFRNSIQRPSFRGPNRSRQ